MKSLTMLLLFHFTKTCFDQTNNQDQHGYIAPVISVQCIINDYSEILESCSEFAKERFTDVLSSSKFRKYYREFLTQRLDLLILVLELYKELENPQPDSRHGHGLFQIEKNCVAALNLNKYHYSKLEQILYKNLGIMRVQNFVDTIAIYKEQRTDIEEIHNKFFMNETKEVKEKLALVKSVYSDTLDDLKQVYRSCEKQVAKKTMKKIAIVDKCVKEIDELYKKY